MSWICCPCVGEETAVLFYLFFKQVELLKLFIYVFLFLGHTLWHIGSYFPDQGSNPCPLHWKYRILTTSEVPLLCYFKVISARVPNLPGPVVAVLGGSVRMEERENWSWWESEERMRRVDFSVSTIKYWSQEAECGLHRWCLHSSIVIGKQLSGSFENQISYLISWFMSL